MLLEIIESAGLQLFVDSHTVRRGLSWSTVTPPGYWFGALLKGHLRIRQSDLGEGEWRGGRCTCFRLTDPASTDHTAIDDGQISGVFIRVAPEDLEALAGPEAFGTLAQPRWGMTPDKRAPAADPMAQALAWQIMGCPLTGAARRLYLTGKALEMMAHLLRQEELGGTANHWTPRDIERFHAARDLLLADLRNPPSVPALARAVGMNARKLNEGFSGLFGETVYAFVKSRRLEGARLMLEAGETSIARVAHSFGYQPAHLATEFRRRFGLAPTALRARGGASQIPKA